MLVLVLRFCAYSYGGVYNRNTVGGELQQERPVRVYADANLLLIWVKLIIDAESSSSSGGAIQYKFVLNDSYNNSLTNGHVVFRLQEKPRNVSAILAGCTSCLRVCCIS